MKFFLGYWCLLFLSYTYSCNQNKEVQKDAFVIIDKNIDESCSFYLMYFFKGEFMYRVATMDSCQNLTRNKYVSAYDNLLRENSDKIPLKKGRIIFETDFSFGNDSLFRKKLIDITEKSFKLNSKIIDEKTDQFTIEIK